MKFLILAVIFYFQFIKFWRRGSSLRGFKFNHRNQRWYLVILPSANPGQRNRLSPVCSNSVSSKRSSRKISFGRFFSWQRIFVEIIFERKWRKLDTCCSAIFPRFFFQFWTFFLKTWKQKINDIILNFLKTIRLKIDLKNS